MWILKKPTNPAEAREAVPVRKDDEREHRRHVVSEREHHRHAV